MNEKSESLIPNSKFLIKFIANDTTSFFTIPLRCKSAAFYFCVKTAIISKRYHN